MVNTRQNQTKKSTPKTSEKIEGKREKKLVSSCDEVARAWLNFKPSLPFSYLVAARKAAQAKNA